MHNREHNKKQLYFTSIRRNATTSALHAVNSAEITRFSLWPNTNRKQIPVSYFKCWRSPWSATACFSNFKSSENNSEKTHFYLGNEPEGKAKQVEMHPHNLPELRSNSCKSQSGEQPAHYHTEITPGFPRCLLSPGSGASWALWGSTCSPWWSLGATGSKQEAEARNRQRSAALRQPRQKHSSGKKCHFVWEIIDIQWEQNMLMDL